MKHFIIIFLIAFTAYSQENGTPFLLDADEFVGIDNIENSYFIKNNTLFKKSKDSSWSYSNIHLSQITRVDITNPLKIVVFYKDFNSVVLLDNKLNELTNTIDFNTILSKNISFVGTTTNSNLWLFSEDDKNLQIWDYKEQRTSITVPLQSDFKYKTACSNYQYIWLVSDTEVLQFNEYGSFIKRFKVGNIKKAIAYKSGIVYQIGKQLFYLNENPLAIQIKETFKITDFCIQNDWIYFFDGKSVNKINLSKN